MKILHQEPKSVLWWQVWVNLGRCRRNCLTHWIIHMLCVLEASLQPYGWPAVPLIAGKVWGRCLDCRSEHWFGHSATLLKESETTFKKMQLPSCHLEARWSACFRHSWTHTRPWMGAERWHPRVTIDRRGEGVGLVSGCHWCASGGSAWLRRPKMDSAFCRTAWTVYSTHMTPKQIKTWHTELCLKTLTLLHLTWHFLHDLAVFFCFF